MGGLTVGLAAAGFAEGGFTNGASPAPVVAAAVVGDPPCGFDVYRGRLTVTSLGARGLVQVWLKGDGWPVRSARIVPGQTVSFALKHRHTAKDFQVAVVAVGRQHDDEQVTWCEPA